MLKRFAWIAFAIGLLLVIVLSVIPAEAFPNLGIREILGHTAAYAALALAGGIAFRTARSLVLLAAGLVFLGAGLELLQGFLPSRDASGYEFLADVIGVTLGSTTAVAINTFVNRRSSGVIRTTNLLERLFLEERRRLKIIRNAFGEKAVLKLMFRALIRPAERWRSIRVSEFERRQELNELYEAEIGLNQPTSKEETQTKVSSTPRT